MENSKALQYLIQICNSNLGYVPSTTVEFNDLSSQIYIKTKSRISVSTIKRIWGYVKYESIPSRTTLNILARFNGFKDWESFREEIDYDAENHDSGFVDDSQLNSVSLCVGDRVVIKWDGEKECALEYIAYLRFKVVSSKNIKLLPGDTGTVNLICLGLPFFMSDIQREGVIIPAYIGAKESGVRSLNVFRS